MVEEKKKVLIVGNSDKEFLTKAQRVAKRRLEVLWQFDLEFAKYCEDESERVIKEGISWHDMLHNALVKMERYINSLIEKKPQDKSFYVSVAFEWQERKQKQMDEIKRRREEKTDDRNKA